MNSKTLMAGVAGGVILFLTGGLFYELLLKDFFASASPKDPLNMVAIGLGELVLGLFLAINFTRAGVSDMKYGARAGFMIGAMIALGYGLIMFGAHTIYPLTQWLVDVVIIGLRWGIAGAVIAKMLATKEMAAA